ncbi:MAG: hypothetical protein ACR2O1_03525, partial [Boseongicola sp.]
LQTRSLQAKPNRCSGRVARSLRCMMVSATVFAETSSHSSDSTATYCSIWEECGCSPLQPAANDRFREAALQRGALHETAHSPERRIVPHLQMAALSAEQPMASDLVLQRSECPLRPQSRYWKSIVWCTCSEWQLRPAVQSLGAFRGTTASSPKGDLRVIQSDPIHDTRLAMSGILDWITLNSWAVAGVAVVAAVVGYAVTRPTALRGISSDDSNAWVAFCMGLYPDTRQGQIDDNAEASDNTNSSIDGSD